jgi:hypothetical protein
MELSSETLIAVPNTVLYAHVIVTLISRTVFIRGLNMIFVNMQCVCVSGLVQPSKDTNELCGVDDCPNSVQCFGMR